MCNYINDWKSGLEIKFTPKQEEQTFYGNTSKIPEAGDLIESRGTHTVYEVIEVRNLIGDVYQGLCKERRE